MGLAAGKRVPHFTYSVASAELVSICMCVPKIGNQKKSWIQVMMALYIQLAAVLGHGGIKTKKSSLMLPKGLSGEGTMRLKPQRTI